jgi:hypothetical protein
MDDSRSIPPRMQIRRFDVFAEYNRLQAEEKGQDADAAKGYGLWLAKVVAARKFSRERATKAALTDKLREGGKEAPEEKYRSLDGEPQTAELFDREIVARMGDEFYREVFQPAMRAAFERHERYEDIRDEIRAGWNAALRASGGGARR